MLPNKKPKPDFLDDVTDSLGESGSKDYGAEMSDDDEDTGGDSEEAGQDRIMAAKQVAKALGMSEADAPRLADALAAFVRAC